MNKLGITISFIWIMFLFFLAVVEGQERLALIEMDAHFIVDNNWVFSPKQKPSRPEFFEMCDTDNLKLKYELYADSIVFTGGCFKPGSKPREGTKPVKSLYNNFLKGNSLYYIAYYKQDEVWKLSINAESNLMYTVGDSISGEEAYVNDSGFGLEANISYRFEGTITKVEFSDSLIKPLTTGIINKKSNLIPVFEFKNYRLNGRKI